MAAAAWTRSVTRNSAVGVTVDLTLQASKTAQAGPGDAKGDILTGFELPSRARCHDDS